MEHLLEIAQSLTDDCKLTGGSQLSAERTISTVQRVSPSPAWRHPRLQAIAAYLNRPDTAAALRVHERERTYPTEVLEDLFELGLGELLAGPAESEDTAPSYHHSFALLERLGAASGSLGITIGINVLAFGTVCMGGNAALRTALAQAIRRGEQCSLVLTEWDQGSDLRGTQAQAESGVLDAEGAFVPVTEDQRPTHYRVTGTKDLINGGRVNRWLITLARVYGGQNAGGLTLLAIP